MVNPFPLSRLQVAVKPVRPHWRSPGDLPAAARSAAGIPNAVTGKRSPGAGYHRQKSRASTRVASSQATPTAHPNRNHCSRSIPYDRCVVPGLPQADNSAKNAATAPTITPLASTTRNGANKSPVASSDPHCGTTNRDNSRGATPSLTMTTQPSHPHRQRRGRPRDLVR